MTLLVRPTSDDRDGRLLDLLRDWLPRRRWYPAKGVDAELTLLGVLPLDDGAGAASGGGRGDGAVAAGAAPEVRVLLVRVAAEGVDATLQVPLVLERATGRPAGAAPEGTVPAGSVPAGTVPAGTAPEATAPEATVPAGTAPEGTDDPAVLGVLDGLVVRDAAAHPAFVRAWLAAADRPTGGRGRHAHDDPALPDLGVDPATAQPVPGEQSNTSVVLRPRTGAPAAAVLKVLRTLNPGENPDVDVPRRLVEVGWPHVPAPLAWLRATWPGPDGEPVEGDLGALSVFVPEARDGFVLACTAAASGDPFTVPAHELGAVVAGMHVALLAAYPRAGRPPRTQSTGGTDPADPSSPGPATPADEVADEIAAHLAWSVAAVPELARFVPGVERILGRLRAAGTLPARQRVHGDLHLGQVLRSQDRWFVTDFEGQPLSPLTERIRPDLALRDVAGMLRSFDYAAAVGGLTGDDARGWSTVARAALLDGYIGAAGAKLDPVLLRALELDKALYEAVYEARNRPDWLAIPLESVERLLTEVPAERPAPAPPAEPAQALAPALPAEPVLPAEPAPAATAARPAKPAPPVEPAPPVAPVPPAPEPSSAAGSPRQWLGETVSTAPVPVPADVLDAVAQGTWYNPHGVLGPHPGAAGEGVTVRVLRPFASAVTVVASTGRFPATHEHEGVWVAVVPGDEVPDYRIETVYEDGAPRLGDDPYRFLPTVQELDRHLIREGRHEQLWTVLGARVRRYPGALGEVAGTSFAVWAPSARAVRVIGDFNYWQGRTHAMRSLGDSGVWELYVPDVGAGSRYKFEVLGADGHWRQKADPLARGTEVPPATASVVVEESFRWTDDDWMARRRSTDPHTGPLSIYEVHLGSWRAGLSYRELADELTAYVLDMGFTHVELLPVAEHPFGGSWGYQVSSYYAPTARFGHPDDLRLLIDTLHAAGIGVILDWVPAHFPKDEWSLARFDGTALYEHPDPLLGEHPDWGTYVFNFGRAEVRNFLVANATYWLEEFHVDGLRVDAVASMLYLDYSRPAGRWRPNVFGGRENLDAIAFLQEANATAYRRSPGVMMIAEESTAWPGVTAPTDGNGLGFGLKWNMGWMNDTLRYLAEEPIYRRYHHHELTFSLVYAYSERFVLPLSHDEVVHGKGSLYERMPGDHWQRLAGVRALLAYQWTHPGKQLLFMGSELAQQSEWAESRSLDWHALDDPMHRGVQTMVRDLNALYRATPALWELDHTPEGFEWIDSDDADDNLLAYLRRGSDGSVAVVVVNFAGVPHEGYRLALPTAGRWLEVFNSDATEYGGSGVGNLGAVDAEPVPHYGRPASAELRVPPLGAVVLVLQP